MGGAKVVQTAVKRQACRVSDRSQLSELNPCPLG